MAKNILLLFISVLLIYSCTNTTNKTDAFVKRNGLNFTINEKPYNYIGANYWYGALLALPANGESGKQRLQKELDFLVSKGVTNLRVLTSAEGLGLLNGFNRVEPPLQPELGKFNEDVLKGLDYLLNEMSKRNMKAVLYLSNNWEWSGGFLQYINWRGLIADTVMRRKLNWDEYRDYTSKFYSCNDCIADYYKQVRTIISRTNSVTGKKYTDDATIMTWELGNEPRPMRPAANTAYAQWVFNTAAMIKSLDSNHLVTIGSEGKAGTETMELLEQVHDNANIDYITMHIWPKNWGWLNDTAWSKTWDSTIINNCKKYMDEHIALAYKLNKPMVMEEFGFPRDKESYNPADPTTFRDKYFTFVFEYMKQNKAFAACNFWGFAGTGRPVPNQKYWKKGDGYLADPPMEEQGLNSVFDSDSSTWKVIEKYIIRND